MVNRRAGYGIIVVLLTGSILLTVKFDVNVKPIGMNTQENWRSTMYNKTKNVSSLMEKVSVSINNTKQLVSLKSKKTGLIKTFIPKQGNTNSMPKNSVDEGDGFKNLTITNNFDENEGTFQHSYSVRTKKRYKVHWYNPPKFLKFRNRAFRSTFAGCEFKNCDLIYDPRQAKLSDVIIFDGRWVPERVKFKRPAGQVWIFAAHESPETYDDLGNWWTKPQWVASFNWTMTYDKDLADIYLPYGAIRPTTIHKHRNFTEIALSKKKTALAIISHCDTHSLREIYIKQLKRYVDVDILGACGEPWECGKRYLHDGCFQILNTTYKFFLAFENAMCKNYFTEKLYENYNYDVVLVVRGGRKDDIQQHLVQGTYISADQFKTASDLGKYLQRLNWSLNEYAKFLEKKSTYKSDGFEAVYKNALCDICKRVNNLKVYGKTIKNIKNLVYSKGKCRHPVV